MNIRGVQFHKYFFTLEQRGVNYSAEKKITLWAVSLSAAYATLKRTFPKWSVRKIRLVPQLEPKEDNNARNLDRGDFQAAGQPSTDTRHNVPVSLRDVG